MHKTSRLLMGLGVLILTASAATVSTLAAAQGRRGTARGAARTVQILTPTVSPEEAESRARARVKITTYSASWCGVCRSARAYLQRQGIHFVERDVERDASAHKRHRALSPNGSLPTIEVDDRVMEGFSPDSFEKLLTEATQTRLDNHDSGGPKTFEIRWR
jgi:glutaredoxin